MFSLTSLAYVPNRIREHVESVFVSNMPFTLNYVKNISHKQDSKATNKQGIRCRFKNKQTSYIPNIYSAYPNDLYQFSCSTSKHFNVKLDDILTVLCTTNTAHTINITSGYHDATDWSAIDIPFGDTLVTVNVSTQLTLKYTKLPVHKGLIRKLQIDDWHCDTVFAHTKITVSKSIASIINLSRQSMIASISLTNCTAHVPSHRLPIAYTELSSTTKSKGLPKAFLSELNMSLLCQEKNCAELSDT